jgi:hypothetical protein
LIDLKNGILGPLWTDSRHKPQKRKFLLSEWQRAINIMLEIPIEIDRLARDKNRGGRLRKGAINIG